MPPRLVLTDDSRPIAEPYVSSRCRARLRANIGTTLAVGTRSSRFLKEAGYRVICIDQRRVHGTGMVWNHIPHGAEDQTGDRPLGERARWIKHAEFFVGLSSGLSWLAWATGTPVVMISGFTHPTNEFDTPYRIINYHTCNSCWNDVRHRFDHNDFLWCPRHKDTPRQFECTRLITAEHVKATIKSIPGFGSHKVAAALAANNERAHPEQVGYPALVGTTARFHRRCKSTATELAFPTGRQRRLPQRETAWASITRGARCSRRDRRRCGGTGHRCGEGSFRCGAGSLKLLPLNAARASKLPLVSKPCW